MSVTTTTNQYQNADWQYAVDHVKTFCAWLTPPVLTEDEINQCVLDAKEAGIWAAEKAVLPGELYIPTQRNGLLYYATEAGVTGTTEPVWPTNRNGFIEDGTTGWRECGVGPRSIYNLRDAKRKAWEMKAAKASALMSTQSPEQRNDAHQVFEHCRLMIASLASISVG